MPFFVIERMSGSSGVFGRFWATDFELHLDALMEKGRRHHEDTRKHDVHEGRHVDVVEGVGVVVQPGCHGNLR